MFSNFAFSFAWLAPSEQNVIYAAGFHVRRSGSRSRKRGGKSVYDLVKIKNQSRKQSHKRNGVGVRRIRTFPFSSYSSYDSLEISRSSENQIVGVGRRSGRTNKSHARSHAL